MTVNDNGHPSLTSTATIHFTLTESAPSNGNLYDEREDGEPKQWMLILILALTSSSLLFLAILSILCKSRKNGQKRQDNLPEDTVDFPYDKEHNALSMISCQTANVFDTHAFHSTTVIGTPEKLHNSVQATAEVFNETPQTFKSKYRSVAGEIDVSGDGFFLCVCLRGRLHRTSIQKQLDGAQLNTTHGSKAMLMMQDMKANLMHMHRPM